MIAQCAKKQIDVPLDQMIEFVVGAISVPKT
jgi:hypothetical protein